MPKAKTHKGAAKRFRVTGKGKVLRPHAFSKHKREVKSAKRKRTLRQATKVASADARRVKELLPHA